MRTALLMISLSLLVSPAGAQRRSGPPVSPEPPAQAKAKEFQIKQQLDSIESRLVKEERLLQARLAEIGKMREVALKANDAKQLQTIEKLEHDAIVTYQTRVKRALDGVSEGTALASPAPSDARPKASGRSEVKSTNPSTNRSKADPKRAPRQDEKRKSRVWPFSR